MFYPTCCILISLGALLSKACHYRFSAAQQQHRVVSNPLAIETTLAGYLSTGGQTAAEIEELALRCPILPTDGLMSMTMIINL